MEYCLVTMINLIRWLTTYKCKHEEKQNKKIIYEKENAMIWSALNIFNGINQNICKKKTKYETAKRKTSAQAHIQKSNLLVSHNLSLEMNYSRELNDANYRFFFLLFYSVFCSVFCSVFFFSYFKQLSLRQLAPPNPPHTLHSKKFYADRQRKRSLKLHTAI